MDSITHALFRAIAADNAYQRRVEAENHPTRLSEEMRGGLQPIGQREGTHQAYLGAAGTDLHISLTRGDELLALQLEFIAAGFVPPATLYLNGGDVIISPGRIELNVSTDKGDATWCAVLEASSKPQLTGRIDINPRKAGWTEQTI